MRRGSGRYGAEATTGCTLRGVVTAKKELRPVMTTTEQIETTKPVAKGNCVHHWLIETPNGRESTGVCKRCGATKEFANSTDQVMWEQTNTLRNDLARPTRSSKVDEYSLADES